MTLQQSLVDALLLSAAAATKHSKGSAWGGDGRRAAVGEADGGNYSGLRSKGGGTRRLSCPLKPRHVVDLSGMASPSSSAPLLLLKSGRERGRRRESTVGRDDNEGMKRTSGFTTPLERHFSSNGSVGSVTVSTAALTVDSSSIELSPPKSIRCHHHRGRGGRRKGVRFEVDANDTVKAQVIEYTDGPSLLEEFDLCYMTRRETKLNKRRAGHFARQFALRHPDRAQIVEQLFASPLRCEGFGGTGDGVVEPDSPRRPSSLPSDGDSPSARTIHMDKANSGGTIEDAVHGEPTEQLQRRLIRGDDNHSEARGLEPFMVPLIRRHQLWSIRATLGRHRQLRNRSASSASPPTRDVKSASPHRDRQEAPEDEDDDEVLRRCCEGFNACTRDLARLLAEADAAAAQRIYLQS